MKKHCKNCTAWGLLILRFAIGAILLSRGYIKLFGQNAELLAFFESTVLPAPGLTMMIAGLLEFIGGAFIILGLWNRITTTILAIEFAVILLFVKLSQGFDAMELEVLLFASLFCLSSTGPGAYALGEWWRKRSLNGAGEKGGHGQEAIGGE